MPDELHRIVAFALVDLSVPGRELVLMEQRTSPSAYAGAWMLPGGSVEPGESWGDALTREMGEELGVRPQNAVCVLERVNRDPPGRTNRMRVYLVRQWEPRDLPSRVRDTGAPLAWHRLVDAADSPYERVAVGADAVLLYLQTGEAVT